MRVFGHHMHWCGWRTKMRRQGMSSEDDTSSQQIDECWRERSAGAQGNARIFSRHVCPDLKPGRRKACHQSRSLEATILCKIRELCVSGIRSFEAVLGCRLTCVPTSSDAADLEDIGMRKLQKRRLERHLGELPEREMKRPRVATPQAAPAPHVEVTQAPRNDAELMDGDWELPPSPELPLDDLIQHESVLVISPSRSLTSNAEMMGFQLIGLQTDLQDDMHVAKFVTNAEEIVSLCNLLQPKSASMIPKLKVNFEKLSSQSSEVVALLGERAEISSFLENLQVPPQTVQTLKTPGLYALIHQQQLFLTLWPAAGFQDQAHRRQMISFIHFVLQLAPKIVWLVRQKDLDDVRAVGAPLRASDTSRSHSAEAHPDGCHKRLYLDVPGLKCIKIAMPKRFAADVPVPRNLDIQISMKSASEDDCKLGAHFAVPLGATFDFDAVRVFSGKQCASFNMMRVQAAGRQIQSAQDIDTIWNFFRLIKDTHVLCFDPSLKVEDCALVVQAVDLSASEEIEKQHKAARDKVTQDFLAREQAITETTQQEKEKLFTKLKETIKDELLRNFPKEFFALHAPLAELLPIDRWSRQINFAIIREDFGKLTIQISVDQKTTFPSGELRQGTGNGEGFWYANMKYPTNGQWFGEVRLKELKDGELQIRHRTTGPGTQWGDECRLSKDLGLALEADASSLNGIVNHVKATMVRLRMLYAFAMVAQSKKWFENSGLDFADSIREMLTQAITDHNAFKEWHQKLVPQTWMPNPFKDRTDLETVKKLILTELKEGILKKPQYKQTLQTYKEALLSSMSDSIRHFSERMFSYVKPEVISQKKDEMRKDWAAAEKNLEEDLKIAYSKAMQSLAPPNAMKVMLKKMTRRYSTIYKLAYDIEVEGSPRLCCRLGHLKVEKHLFEEAISRTEEFQVQFDAFSAQEFRVDVRDPEDVHLVGSLGQDRVFCILSHQLPEGGKGIKFWCGARNQTGRELLNVKRQTSLVAFNESLRMLALYNEGNRMVAVYAWDESFTQRTEYCAPIFLDAYMQDAELLQMHFLPASKQLCFVFRNCMVKIYELVAKTMRPRGFTIEPGTKTFVDSTGTSLVVLRQTSANWEIDVMLAADGRKVKTLKLPVQPSEPLPVVDILRLYGVDFLVVVDSKAKILYGWKFQLQTAEQVCSMEQLSNKVHAEPTRSEVAGGTCFDVLYQVLAKFTTHPALGDTSQQMVKHLAVVGPAESSEMGPAIEQYEVSYAYVSSIESAGDVVSSLHTTAISMDQLLRKLICLVPLQIARAENESFVILKDGLREEVGGFTNLSELSEFISFGLYELILESNENPVVVISSMGKQSTGKSYMLNHLAGEVFNAAISHVSLFRTENRLDCDTASIFSRMQQGAKLIQGDDELFNGVFQIVVKDVVSDAKEVAHEFMQKIQHIIARDKEDNFFLRLYRGRVLTSDGPTPLLHLRSNKTFVEKCVESDEPEMGAILSALPDEGLQLAIVQDKDGILDVEVTGEIMNGLLSKLKDAGANFTADHASQALQALAHRRQKRIVAWLEANVEHVAGEGDAQRLVMDHFHTQGDGGDGCMCDQPHQCPHECEAPGICEIYSELVVKKQKFSGKHDTFDYDAIETEQNGVRKGCCKVVPPKSRQHEGGHIHSSTENLVHYCDVKCPTCGYYCTLPWEHSGEHDTRHGNMRRTYFVSDEDVFTVGSRKYAPSERPHTHVKLCADYSNGQPCCVSAMPGRRHSKRQYKPNPEIPKDEFTHEAFWESIGFKDPCSSEDKECFGKCNHFCPHPSHTKDGETPSFCTLPLWHEELAPGAGREHIRQHGGIVSTDGHHFKCTHQTSQPVHTVFLIDKSSSMRMNDVVPETWPWRQSHPNRLGCALAAVQSFVEKRRHSSPDDKISLLAFDGNVLNGPSMVSIMNFDTCQNWLSRLNPSGGTSFSAAIASAVRFVQQTPSGNRSMIVFLSDGESSYPADALRMLFAAVSRSAPGRALRLHTIQFPSQRGSSVLSQMTQAARSQATDDDEFAKASSSMQSVRYYATEPSSKDDQGEKEHLQHWHGPADQHVLAREGSYSNLSRVLDEAMRPSLELDSLSFWQVLPAKKQKVGAEKPPEEAKPMSKRKKRKLFLSLSESLEWEDDASAEEDEEDEPPKAGAAKAQPVIPVPAEQPVKTVKPQATLGFVPFALWSLHGPGNAREAKPEEEAPVAKRHRGRPGKILVGHWGSSLSHHRLCTDPTLQAKELGRGQRARETQGLLFDL
eukprot:Skav211837  [mRNA]  locus=scaffold305:669633:690103:- [translate_table: standard]